MSILKSLFSNSSLTDSILKNFVADYKAKGIKQVLISINEDDALQVEQLTDEFILVKKSDYNFLTDFFTKVKETL